MHMTSLLHLVELMSEKPYGDSKVEYALPRCSHFELILKGIAVTLVTAYAGQKCKVQLLYHMNKVKCFRSWLQDKYYDDKDTYFVIG